MVETIENNSHKDVVETIENNSHEDVAETIENNSHEDVVEVGLAVFRSFEEVVDGRLQSPVAGFSNAESPEPDERRPSRQTTPELKVSSADDLIALKVVVTDGRQFGHASMTTASPPKPVTSIIDAAAIVCHVYIVCK